MTSAQDLLRSEDCTFPGCPAEAERDGLCRHHLPKQPSLAIAPTVREQWPADAIVAAIKRWASEHDGRPPRQKDWIHCGAWWPSFHVPTRVFGSWSAAIEAAGFPKPTRNGGRKAKTSSTAAVADQGETGSADHDPGEGDRSTPSAPSPLPVQPHVPENIDRALLISKLRWAVGGEWSVPISPTEAEQLLEVLA